MPRSSQAQWPDHIDNASDDAVARPGGNGSGPSAAAGPRDGKVTVTHNLKRMTATSSSPDAPSVNTPSPAMAWLEAWREWQQSMGDDWLARHRDLWQRYLGAVDVGAASAADAAQSEDARFRAPAWSDDPYFAYLREAYAINAEFCLKLPAFMTDLPARERERMGFMLRQFVEACAPSNFAATNPEFIRRALETGGASITQGIANLLADLRAGRISTHDASAFRVGHDLASTPGSVVFENALMQLIQYRPTTARVHARPLLIVPPCVNKYYILDLRPDNSFVRHALDRGHTVFMISWRNPGADLGHLTWDDYLRLGPIAALNTVRAISGCARPNALGFCVGGTLLACAVAALADPAMEGADPVTSLTLLTTPLDFSRPGELGLFVAPDMLRRCETQFAGGGLVPGRDFERLFSSLRANDLIWRYVVSNYLKGEQPTAFDILFWNSDCTNLPGPMVAWYLRHMYLDNALVTPGRLSMLGVAVDLRRIRCPVYLMGAREDHIVPWQTCYFGARLLGGEPRFVLGASGHVAGVINPAAANRRSHWSGKVRAGEPDDWLLAADEIPGSWWHDWTTWVAAFGGPLEPAPRRCGSDDYAEIEPAPGRYVLAGCEG